MADDRFLRYINRVLSHEGGYTRHRADRGNWTSGSVGVGELKGTKFGIAANTYPDLDIENLTRDEAIEIYRRDFWNACRCDDMPWQVSFQVLDSAVNHGIFRTKMLLQEAVRVKVDGRIGPVTLQAIQCMDPADLLLRFCAARIRFYVDLQDFPIFGRGWMRRMADNLLHASEDN